MRGRNRVRFGAALCVVVLGGASLGWGATFSGRVYEGSVGDESQPLSGVGLCLEGASEAGGPRAQIDSTSTDGSGWYGLSGEGYEYYWIVATGKAGYVFEGSSSVGGSASGAEIAYDTLRAPLSEQTLTGNRFWYQAEGQSPPPASENHPPTAGDDAASTGENVAADIDVLANDSDPDGDALHVNSATDPAHGTTVNHGTHVTYTPDVGFTGTDTFDYTAGDGKGGTDTATVTVTVAPDQNGPSGVGILNGYKRDAASGQGLANWRIYVDLNQNGQWDGGEPSDLTDGNGYYEIGGLAAGQYSVCEVMQAGWQGDSPCVSVTIVEGVITTQDFHNRRIEPTESQYDYGDAPASYGLAWHTVQAGLSIGVAVDVDAAAQTSAAADGDDTDGSDDEDGMTLSAGLAAGKTVEICLLLPNGDALAKDVAVAGWIDFDGDGHWNASAEQIFIRAVHLPAKGYVKECVQVTVPQNAKAGTTFARFRLFGDTGGPGVAFAALPTGDGGIGEVEDYVLYILSDGPGDGRDYGDAPLPYPEASHALGGPYLGPLGDVPDGETGMQRDAQAGGDDGDANGDDENGLLSINLVKTAGQWSLWDVKGGFGTSSDARFGIWIDFNRDGDWDDAGELVSTFGFCGFGTGPQDWYRVTGSFPLPEGASVGTTYVRVRVYDSCGASVSAGGAGGPGEVEDYAVEIQGSGPGVPAGGIVHGYKWNDINGNGLWDIVTPNEPALAGWTIWLDTNQNGTYDGGDMTTTTDAQGHFRFTGVPAGTFALGEQVVAGWTQTTPGGTGTYAVTVQPGQASFPQMFGNRQSGGPGATQAFDWGDAPDPGYPTRNASNGARHAIVAGMFLGGGVDGETDGQPGPDALGDDLAGDDEDGVYFLGPLMPGAPAEMEVVASAAGKVDAWIDFDADGNWTQGSDRILQGTSVAPGSNLLTFSVPAGARRGEATCARVRFSSQGGLSPGGGAQDGEVEDYRIVLGPEGPGMAGGGDRAHVKWSQPAVEIDPHLEAPVILCGWNESARSTQQGGQRRQWRMDADDFRCLGPVPVTRIRWWGGYKGWDSPEPPASQPVAWHIGFWANEVEGLSAEALYPERLVWSLEVADDRVGREAVAVDDDPSGFGEACFVCDLRLEPEEWFHQAEFASNDRVFWISITAIYPADAEPMNMWGWRTRPPLWGGAAVMPAIMGEEPTYEERLFPGRIITIESTRMCGVNQTCDLCFELFTEAPWMAWDQPFAGVRDWRWYADEMSEALEVEGGEVLMLRQAADEWVCRGRGPIVAASWWGSYLDYGYESCGCDEGAAPRRPDYFLLSIWSSAEANDLEPYEHPGEKVWEYAAYDYDEVLVGHDGNPAGEPNEPVFRYAVRLPEEAWLRPTAADTVYWFSVVPVFRESGGDVPYRWGWTTHPHESGSGAVLMDYRLRMVPQWQRVRDGAGEPAGLSFTLFTTAE